MALNSVFEAQTPSPVCRIRSGVGCTIISNPLHAPRLAQAATRRHRFGSCHQLTRPGLPNAIALNRAPRGPGTDGSSNGLDSSRCFLGRICRDETWVAPRNQEKTDMDATTVDVNLPREIFEVSLANRAGRIVERRRLTHRQFERFIEGLALGTELLLEGCSTTHYWGRRCRAGDLRVRLLPVQCIRPYVRRNKTDRTGQDRRATDTARDKAAPALASMEKERRESREEPSEWQSDNATGLTACRAAVPIQSAAGAYLPR